MEHPADQLRVLVCVVSQPADLRRIERERWYRIPLARAPRSIAVDYLAFYLTGVFGRERWSVRSYAAVQSISIVSRQELLPDEVDHPRAGERYWRFALGPLIALAAPVVSRRLRRISFIPTTLERLQAARDVAELWTYAIPDPAELWGAGIGRRALHS